MVWTLAILLWEILPQCPSPAFWCFDVVPPVPPSPPPPRHAKVLQHRLQDLFRSPSTMDHIIDLGQKAGAILQKVFGIQICLLNQSQNPGKLCCIWIFWYDYLYNALEDVCKEDKSVHRHLSTKIWCSGSLPSSQVKQGGTTLVIRPQKPDSQIFTWCRNSKTANSLTNYWKHVSFHPFRPQLSVFLCLIHPKRSLNR